MSDVIENTLSSLSRLLTENLISSISGSSPTSVKPQRCSKGFENFIRAVSGARNKHEEDEIIKRELAVMQQRLAQPDVSVSQMKDFMVRVIYSGMLGHDISFACIHAMKLAQHGKIQEKRIGYLAASLLLHEDHELILLLINTIQKDLASSNMLENCMGLMAVCQLVNTEMAPMLLPAIIEKLKHPRPIVRMKAVMCLQKFNVKSPSCVQHLSDNFRQALCDKSPSVMICALPIYLQLIQADPDKHHGLVKGFVNTLRQVISRKLPGDYDYHSIPAPWVQIKLLKILAALGRGQQRNSSLMYEVLRETLERATVKDNAAYAILYECIVTITSIWPNSDLLYTAASYVGKFLRSKGNNLRYAGLKALGDLVKCGCEYVTDYHMIVVECLEDPDQSIQKKTYDLLYQMTNSSNVQVICKRLLDYLVRSKDEFVRSEIVTKITELVVNYAPSHQWYITSMNQLMEVSGDQTPTRVSESLLNVIQKGCSEPGPAGQTLREYVIEIYQKFVHRPSLPSTLLSVTAWVIGEYCEGVASTDMTASCESLVRHYQSPATEQKCRYYILAALQKMFIRNVMTAAKLVSVMDMLESSTKGYSLKQRITELKLMSRFEPEVLQMLKPDTNGKKMDFTMSFLDDYVSEALESGAAAYKPRQIRLNEVNKKHADVKSILDEIQYERYSSSPGSPRSGNSGERRDGQQLEGSADSVCSGNGKLETRTTGINLTGVKRVWGRAGVIQQESPVTITGPGSEETPSDLKPLQQQLDGTDKTYEERRRKEDLAAALFSGLSSQSSLSSASPMNSRIIDVHQGISTTQGFTEESDTSRGVGSSFSLFQHSEQPKAMDVLVKHKPSDGHDWRSFSKSDLPHPDDFETCPSDKSSRTVLPSFSNMEKGQNNPVCNADDHSMATDSSQETGDHQCRNDIAGDCASGSSHVPGGQSSLYETLIGELTEEDLILATSAPQHQQTPTEHS